MAECIIYVCYVAVLCIHWHKYSNTHYVMHVVFVCVYLLFISCNMYVCTETRSSWFVCVCVRVCVCVCVPACHVHVFAYMYCAIIDVKDTLYKISDAF